MSGIEISHSPRGFALFGDDVKTAENFHIRVQESSSAEMDAAWLFIENDAGVGVSVHMTVDQAQTLATSLEEGSGPQIPTDYRHVLQVLPHVGHVALTITKGAPLSPGDLPACNVRMLLSDAEASALQERLDTYVEFVTP